MLDPTYQYFEVAEMATVMGIKSLWQRVAERQHQLKSTLIKHQHYQELSTAASQLDVAAMQQTIDLRLHNQSQALDDLNRAVLDLGHTVGTRVEPIKTKPIQDPSTLAVNDNTTTSEDAIFDMLGHPDYATSHRR
ncbi:hypothetical protein H4R34_003987 [Dimargaris verticillata]|uniref:Uncharacterized protein n=1 Tax=Dimargaris verticillata TaxID=2761393 RepID=A0A9W8E7P2_9FUNG|nr:hypothetical protein H4R34_003987 [Dimargaris verticillata]